MAKYTQYKVLHIVEGALGAIFLGASSIPVKKMEIELNKELENGWEVVFQVVEKKRLFLFWQREAIILTLGKIA